MILTNSILYINFYNTLLTIHFVLSYPLWRAGTITASRLKYQRIGTRVRVQYQIHWLKIIVLCISGYEAQEFSINDLCVGTVEVSLSSSFCLSDIQLIPCLSPILFSFASGCGCFCA